MTTTIDLAWLLSPAGVAARAAAENQERIKDDEFRRRWKQKLLSGHFGVSVHRPQEEKANELPINPCSLCDRARRQAATRFATAFYDGAEGHWLPCCKDVGTPSAGFCRPNDWHRGDEVCPHCFTRHGVGIWHASWESFLKNFEAQFEFHGVNRSKFGLVMQDLIRHPFKAAPFIALLVATQGGAAALAGELGISTVAAGASIGSLGGAVGATASHARGSDFYKQVVLGAVSGAASAHVSSLQAAAAGNAAAQHTASSVSAMTELKLAHDAIQTQIYLTVAAQAGTMAVLEGKHANPALTMVSNVLGHAAGQEAVTTASNAISKRKIVHEFARDAIQRTASAVLSTGVQVTIESAFVDKPRSHEKKRLGRAIAIAGGVAVMGSILRAAWSWFFQKPKIPVLPIRRIVVAKPQQNSFILSRNGVTIQYTIIGNTRVMILSDPQKPGRVVAIRKHIANTKHEVSHQKTSHIFYRRCKAAGGDTHSCARQLGLRKLATSHAANCQVNSNPKLLARCLNAGGQKEQCQSFVASIDPKSRIRYRFVKPQRPIKPKPNPFAPSGQYP